MALLLTGVIMLIYHSGITEQVKILFLRGDQWLQVHRVLTVIALPLVALHLIFHWGSIIRLFFFGKKTKHKPLNLTLFLFLLCTALTSLLSWLIFGESEPGEWLRAVHNKFGMGLMVFFSVHIAIHLSWLVRMSDRYLINKSRTRDQKE